MKIAILNLNKNGKSHRRLWERGELLRKNRFSKQHQNPRKKHFIQGFLIAVFLLVAGIGASFNVNAANTYDIADVGVITNFDVRCDGGACDTPQGAVPFTSTNSTTLSSVQILGEIPDLSKVSSGDVINITITATPTSTFSPAHFNNTRIIVSDELFDITSRQVSKTIVISLTRTNSPASSINAYFEIDGDGFNLEYQPPNSTSTQSVFNVATLSATVLNQPKANCATKLDSIGISHSTDENKADFSFSTSLDLVYDDLLSGMTREQLIAKYGDLLTQNYVQVLTVAPDPQIVAVDLYGKVGSRAFDLFSGTELNTCFFVTNKDGSDLTVNKVSLGQNLSFNDVVSYMTTQPGGSYGVAKNADGSYTVAVNWGKLLGDGIASFPPGTDVTGMPNTQALNAENQALVDNAIAMKLAAEWFKQSLRVTFADKTIENMANVNLQTNLIPGTISDSVTTFPVRATEDGEATIKVHYVDTSNNPLAEFDVSMGFSHEEPVPSPDYNASPKNIAGYTLLTDRKRLDQFASNLQIDSNNVLDAEASILYPQESYTTDVYYVYLKDPICQYDPALEASDPNCKEKITPPVPNPENPSPESPNPNAPGVPSTGISSQVVSFVGVVLVLILIAMGARLLVSRVLR